MVEEGVGLQMLADLLGILELPLGDVVDELVHGLGLLVEVDEAVLNLHQIVALLKDAGGHIVGDKLLIAVHLLGLSHKGSPILVGEDHVGRMDFFLPLGHVGADDLVAGVDREGAGGAGRPGTGHAPGVDDVHLARLGGGVGGAVGIADNGKGLKLIDVAVRIAAADGFQ